MRIRVRMKPRTAAKLTLVSGCLLIALGIYMPLGWIPDNNDYVSSMVFFLVSGLLLFLLGIKALKKTKK